LVEGEHLGRPLSRVSGKRMQQNDWRLGAPAAIVDEQSTRWALNKALQRLACRRCRSASSGPNDNHHRENSPHAPILLLGKGHRQVLARHSNSSPLASDAVWHREPFVICPARDLNPRDLNSRDLNPRDLNPRDLNPRDLNPRAILPP
jgi:hypothetical protein